MDHGERSGDPKPIYTCAAGAAAHLRQALARGVRVTRDAGAVRTRLHLGPVRQGWRRRTATQLSHRESDRPRRCDTRSVRAAFVADRATTLEAYEQPS